MQLIHSGKKYRNSTAGGIYLWVAVNECGHINKGTSLGRSKKTFWLRVKVNHIFIYASEERGENPQVYLQVARSKTTFTYLAHIIDVVQLN